MLIYIELDCNIISQVFSMAFFHMHVSFEGYLIQALFIVIWAFICFIHGNSLFSPYAAVIIKKIHLPIL